MNNMDNIADAAMIGAMTSHAMCHWCYWCVSNPHYNAAHLMKQYFARKESGNFNHENVKAMTS
jgi:hypothetical protein